MKILGVTMKLYVCDFCGDAISQEEVTTMELFGKEAVELELDSFHMCKSCFEKNLSMFKKHAPESAYIEWDIPLPENVDIKQAISNKAPKQPKCFVLLSEIKEAE